MRKNNHQTLLEEKERECWELWNQQAESVKLTPEQCLEWLDGVRAFMFEVWRENPHLRREYERLRSKEGSE